MTAPEYSEYVVTMNKGWESRFVSHLDVMRAIMRGLRRTGLPLYFSQGFNPRPKISYATPPLPVGATSACESVSLRLEREFPDAEILSLLQSNFPAGLMPTAAAPAVPGLKPFQWFDCVALILDEDGVEKQPDELFSAISASLILPPERVAAAGFEQAAPGFGEVFSRFYGYGYKLRLAHSETSGSPLKALAEHLRTAGRAHHFHRAGYARAGN